MKLEFTDTKYGNSIELKPETVEEVAKMFRLAKNAKRAPVEIHLSFSSDNPYLNIWIPKVKETVQINSVNNKR